MPDRGIGSWIDRRADIDPGKRALIWGDRVFTYAEMAARVRGLASGLKELGLRRGERVAWLGPNHPAFLELLFATAKLGAILAPVNQRNEKEVIKHVLKDVEPSLVVIHRSVDLAEVAEVGETLVVGGEQDGYEHLVADHVDDPIDVDVTPDEVCMLPYTSGTTGWPKGVMLTHGNLTWNVVNFLSAADFSSDDVTVAIAPFFRVGGTGVNVLPVLFKGGTVVVPEHGDPDEIVSLIERHRVTIGFGNPDLLEAISVSGKWKASDLSQLRMIITGGAPVPERLIRQYFDRGVPLVQGYGLSEAAPLVLVLDHAHASEKVGSAGKPPLFVDVRIADPNGRECGVQETGELLVRGPNVMKGYWRLPQVTERVIVDGWLHTGDAARRDEEGFIWIVDRMKDAYLSEGTLVYPGDVERALSEHPEVLEVGVVGVPGASSGSQGHVFVVVKGGAMVTEEELLAFCRDRLPGAQVPVSVRFVDHLPRNPVGKLVRAQLAALATAVSR